MGPPGLLGSIALACFVGISTPPAAASERSISTSRQFIVYGNDLAARGIICELAERTKRELLGLVGQRDDWTLPIVINARRPQANLPELPRLKVDLGQTGFGLRLQLDLLIDPATNRAEIRRELLRALILEMIYRREPQLPSGATYASPPDWLLDGIPSEESDLPRERVAALLALSATSGNVWPLHRFVAQRTELLDAAARKLCRAYSSALVDLLSRRPDGPRRLMQFILDLPRASNDPMEELRNHFPEVFGMESAEVTWQKQIAHLSSDQAYQLLSTAETERRLGEILRLRISDRGPERTYDLVQFLVFQKDKAAKKALVALANNLTAFGTRAHPVYAPIIAEYAQIVSSIERGRTLSVPKRLAQLASTRKAMSAQMREIDDYLNWFEATSLVKPSGQFADYMQAAERAAQPWRTKRDSISVYLDALEIQFERE
jgi:hypothetical protein